MGFSSRSSSALLLILLTVQELVMLTAWHGPFQEPPVEIRHFGDKGYGLVATRQLNKNEIVFTGCICRPNVSAESWF